MKKAYENYVTKQGKARLSTKDMSDLMYAIVMCRARELETHGIGIYEYSRKQNSYNLFDFQISIDKDRILEFEAMTGIRLKDPIKIQLNYPT